MAKQQKQPYDARTDPDVPHGMSIELLKDLHLLTRDGQLKAARRRASAATPVPSGARKPRAGTPPAAALRAALTGCCAGPG